MQTDDKPQSLQEDRGILYVVATPLGHLEDITFRAVRILKSVHTIAAEDTRHTLKLLGHYGITVPLISCHEHNEHQRIDQVLGLLDQGRDVALVSDAGTPTISDPGYRLVRAVASEGAPVIPIPGPCAAVAGLSVSGLPSDMFRFLGFLHRKKGRRHGLLTSLKDENATLIIYESPHRLCRLLAELLDILGDRPAMVGREMTKMHEEFVRGSVSELLADFSSRASVKGECVVFLGADPNPASATADPRALEAEMILALEQGSTPPSRLARQLSRKYGRPRQEIYQHLSRLKKG